jgi:hypothetical protein
MYHAVVWLVDRQFSCAGDIAHHAGVLDAGLPGLERPDDPPRHEHPASLAGRIVDPVAEDLAIRAAEMSPQ